jgi:hypothetical protein
MNDRVIAALIGAIVVAVGWLFNSRRERQQSRARRRERVVDIQKAIRAEIKALVEAPQNRDLSGSLERGMARFDAETPEEPYVPFIPHEKHDTVFQALVGDVHLLPTETVEPVILYYNQTVAIGMMAHDLRSEKFAALDVERRKQMLRRYMEMKIEAMRMGRIAIEALGDNISRQVED